MSHAPTPDATATQPQVSAAPPAAQGRPRLQMAAPRRGKPPRHLADMTLPERKDALVELGLPGFRADQVSRHYFSHLTRCAQDMTDLPAEGREELVEALLPDLVAPAHVMQADGGDTVKTLWRMHDGAKVESVLMRYSERTTLCVSSQAGCGMACPFCATGQLGLTRNLSTAEIIEQVRHAARASRDGDLPGGPCRLSNIVFMGMGSRWPTTRP